MMRFLRLFWTTLKGFIQLKFLDSVLEDIDPQEDLTRYLLSRNQFSPSNKRVKSSAFLPPQNLKLSVFRIKDLSDENIWKIGTDKVANRINPPKSLHARADFMADVAISKGLQIIPDKWPTRHANIVGWPEEKPKRKEIALELAANAHLEINPFKNPVMD